MGNIKTTILDRVIEELETQIKNAERGRLDAIKDSQAHKGAMESRYDTFKEEAQYLAGGLHTQVTALNKTLSALRSIRNYPLPITKGSGYAIMEVEDCDDGSRTKYFLLPAGGGNTYEVEGEVITILTVGAPIAHALIGAVAGDEVEIKIQATTRRFRVISVA